MRHYSTSVVMVSQSYKSVPKVVRVNASVLILFAIANHAELESLYEENSAGLTKDTWLEIYKECTAEPFSFMTINYMRPRGHRVFLRFEQEIATPEETADTGEILRRKGASAVGQEESDPPGTRSVSPPRPSSGPDASPGYVQLFFNMHSV